jgi:AbrB family looped-hinge helix DNA binding protein
MGGTTTMTKGVKVTRKGQITLPVALRKEFGIEEGDTVFLHRSDRGIEILTSKDWVARTAGMFRDYAADGPLEWDREEIWTEIARERFERTLEDDPKEAARLTADSSGGPYDRD